MAPADRSAQPGMASRRAHGRARRARTRSRDLHREVDPGGRRYGRWQCGRGGRCWWRSMRCGSWVCRGVSCTHWRRSWAATCRSRCTAARRSARVAASSWQRCWPATPFIGCWHSLTAASPHPRCSPRLDRLRADADREQPPWLNDPEPLLAALASGDAGQLAPLLGNDLQAAALSLNGRLRRTLRAGIDAGALAGLVSGSGPTCAFLCSSAASAIDVGVQLAGEGVCRTVRAASGPVHGARVVPAPSRTV